MLFASIWFFVCFCANFHSNWALFREVYPKLKSGSPIKGDPGQPLFLTPLIKAGHISLARTYSTVPEFLPNISSNAGYFTVNETYNSNLFFWFFRKTSADWQKSPVVIWLQGGPGSSSLFGLFSENGPFIAAKDGLQRRKYSWTNEFNVLYVDNPVGTGFSFTNNEKGYVTNQTEVGRDLYSALTQFFQLYPELARNDFYITGESYAGKYIPALAYTIHQKNRRAAIKIKLKGLFIGNGFCDPSNMLDYGRYLRNVGLLNRRQEKEFLKVEDDIRLSIRSGKWLNASRLFDKLIGDENSLFYKFTGFPLYYDYKHENMGGDDSYMTAFLDSSETRKGIHVGSMTYNDGQKVYEHLYEDVPKSVKPWIEELLEVYAIMFYSGQLDIIVAYPLSENFFRHLFWRDALMYNDAPRQKWYIGKHLAGYYKVAGNLIDVLVRDAGHMVPTSQPKYALSLLKSFTLAEFNEIKPT